MLLTFITFVFKVHLGETEEGDETEESMLDQSESVVTDNGIEEAEEADNGGYTEDMGLILDLNLLPQSI